jgi:predicted nucleotidyltransferase
MIKIDIEPIKQIIADWASKEPLVKRVYIFGSRTTNDNREDSDIDVAVEIHRLAGEKSITAAWMDVAEGYREQLCKLLPYPLHLLDGDSLIILDGAYRNGILVYEEPKD